MAFIEYAVLRVHGAAAVNHDCPLSYCDCTTRCIHRHRRYESAQNKNLSFATGPLFETGDVGIKQPMASFQAYPFRPGAAPLSVEGATSRILGRGI